MNRRKSQRCNPTHNARHIKFLQYVLQRVEFADAFSRQLARCNTALLEMHRDSATRHQHVRRHNGSPMGFNQIRPNARKLHNTIPLRLSPSFQDRTNRNCQPCPLPSPAMLRPYPNPRTLALYLGPFVAFCAFFTFWQSSVTPMRPLFG